MPTIRSRKQANGSTRYTAIVRVRRKSFVLHQESRTFAHRSAALTWARHREVELETPEALVKAKHGAPTLAALIRWYIDTFKPIAGWGRTKQTTLEFLEKHAMGKRNVLELTAAELIDHVRKRRASGTGPATAGGDLTWIGVVLRAAKSVTQLPVRPELVTEARTACRELRLIRKSRKRSRRPTAEELAKLDGFFARQARRSKTPMRDIFWFAINSSRRQSEICHLLWSDNDDHDRTGMVRDAKHPTEKIGNHRRFKYTLEGWEIVQRQRKSGPFVFPHDPKTVSVLFTRACKVLGIEDLTFHDLRHEATSRLFERGYQIHEVAQFTLHDSWNELKRYANLRPENLRDIPAPPLPLPAPWQPNTSAPRAACAARARAARRSTRPSQRRSPAKATSDRLA